MDLPVLPLRSGLHQSNQNKIQSLVIELQSIVRKAMLQSMLRE